MHGELEQVVVIALSEMFVDKLFEYAQHARLVCFVLVDFFYAVRSPE